MSGLANDGYSMALTSEPVVEVPAPTPEPPLEVDAEVNLPTEPIHTGGGWYTFTDATDTGHKIQGRAAAYEAAGLDLPEEE